MAERHLTRTEIETMVSVEFPDAIAYAEEKCRHFGIGSFEHIDSIQECARQHLIQRLIHYKGGMLSPEEIIQVSDRFEEMSQTIDYFKILEFKHIMPKNPGEEDVGDSERP
jgi:hypothetical protein